MSILTCLRWFRAFREMEAELAESASARIKAEDEVRTMRDRMESAIESRDRAREELNRALKSIANHEAIRHGSPNVPFPEVFVPMPQPEQQPLGEQRPQPPRTMREAEQISRTRSRREAEDRRRNLNAVLDSWTEN